MLIKMRMKDGLEPSLDVKEDGGKQ